MGTFLTLTIIFIIVFVLNGIIDTLLKNNPSIKRWLLSSLIITVLILLVFVSTPIF